MRQKSLATLTLCLAVATLGLGGYLALTSAEPTSDELESRATHLLPVFRKDEITELTLDGPLTPGELRLRHLSSDPPGSFRIVDGNRLADDALVAQLFATLERETCERELTSNELSEAEQLLRDPELRLQLSRGANQDGLLVSAPSPQGSVYVQSSGSGREPKLCVARRDLSARILPLEQSFAERLLLPFGKGQLERVVTEQGSEGVAKTIELKADGAFFRLGNGGPRVDRDHLDAFFFQAARCLLKSSVTRTEAEKALQQAGDLVRVTMFPKEGPPVSVRLGGICPSAAAEPGLITALEEGEKGRAGCVERTVLAGLAQSEEALTSRTILPLHPDELDHIEWKTTAGTLDVLREGTGFHATYRGPLELDSELGNKIFRAMTTAPGQLVAPGQAPSDLNAVGSLRAVGHGPNDAEVHETLHVFQRVAETWVQRGDGHFLLLPASISWIFEEDPSWARSLTVLTLAPEQLVAVQWKTPWGDLKVQWQDGQPKLSGGAGELDSTALGEILRALAPLRARAFLKEAIRPWATLSFERIQGPPVELKLGQTTAGGLLAQVSDQADPFLLDANTVRLLGSLPLTRQTGVPSLEGVTELQVRWPSASASWERKGSLLVAAEPTAPRAGEEWLATLAELTPVFVGQSSAFSRATQAGGPPPLVLQFKRDGAASEWTFSLVTSGEGAWPGPRYAARRTDSELIFFYDVAAVEPLLLGP